MKKYHRECGAKKRNGEPCQGAAMANGRCRLHGGKMPSGMATRATKHGRYSKDIPTRLAGRYEAAEHDPELLSMRAEVHLLDARLSDVLSRVDTGESGRIWSDLKAAAAELRYAQARHDNAATVLALNTMLSLVREGHQDYAAWQDVRSLLEQRRRTVESERKRLVEMQQTITAEKAMLLIGAIAGIVKAHVSDTKQLAAISRDIGALLDTGASIEVIDGRTGNLS